MPRPLQFKTHNPVVSAQLTLLFFKLSLTLQSWPPHLTLHRLQSGITGQWSHLWQILVPIGCGHLGGKGLGFFSWTCHGSWQGFRPRDAYLTFNTWSPGIGCSFYLPPSSHLPPP